MKKILVVDEDPTIEAPVGEELPTLKEEKLPTIEELMATLKGPKRLTDEPFDDYKVRRKIEKAVVNYYLKGRLVWDSSEKGPYNGVL